MISENHTWYSGNGFFSRSNLPFLMALAIPLLGILGLSLNDRRNSQERTRQEFQTNTSALSMLENQVMLDVDNNGTADLIVDRSRTSPGGYIRFYKPGFERKTGYDLMPKYSLPMSSSLEAIATTMLKNYSELRYQEERTGYDAKKIIIPPSLPSQSANP